MYCGGTRVARPGPSSDFAGRFAPAHPVMAEQVLDPTGWGQPARFVRIREQPRDIAGERRRLLGGEVPCQLVQQAHELTDVGRAGDMLSPSEPALELRTGGAAGSRAVQEIPQTVRADGDLGCRAPQ